MKIKQVKISDINPAKYNPRKITDKELAGLKESLKKFGFVEPLIVNTRTNTLVGGHQRLKAAESLGHTDVPVMEVDLSLSEEKALNVALNSSTISGKYDEEILKELLAEIKMEIPDIFSNLNMDEMFPEAPVEHIPTEGLTDEDAVPEVPVVPNTKRGDIYILGNHRLMCGDSTMIDEVEKLLQKEKPDMIFTDPPYNVAFNGRSGKHDVIKNDELADDDFENFIDEVCQTIKAINAPIYYIWCNWKFYSVLQTRLDYKACIVWAKNVFGLGIGYRHQHEFCLFNGKIDEEIKNESDLWNVKKDHSYVHPTQKPVELAERAFKNHKNAIKILDLFGGSGSTLIASEKNGKKAYLMELDEKYCDVIIKRWEDFTGKKAVLE